MNDAYNNEFLVIGGGVIGLTTAIVLAEQGRRVRVWTRDPVERTTSAVAGGLWWPYRIQPEVRVGDWALASLTVYEEQAERPEETGVRLVAGVHGETSLDELGAWASRVAGLRRATAEEYPGGTALCATVPLIDMPTHLRWLRKRLLDAGGAIETRTAGTLAEAADTGAAVVVNCTGLGARELVPDPAVAPVRGQLVVVENPGVTTWLTSVNDTSTAGTYFLPQPGGLILGGTADEDAWSLSPDPAVAKEIVARCAALVPRIADARVLDHRVGLRPGRPEVRLESERLSGGGLLVHNYGHGGAGITVAWGCAHEAAGLATAG